MTFKIGKKVGRPNTACVEVWILLRSLGLTVPEVLVPLTWKANTHEEKSIGTCPRKERHVAVTLYWKFIVNRRKYWVIALPLYLTIVKNTFMLTTLDIVVWQIQGFCTAVIYKKKPHFFLTKTSVWSYIMTFNLTSQEIWIYNWIISSIFG